MLKLPDYIALQNTLLIKDFFNEDLPKPLNEQFKKLNDQHRHATRSSAHNSIFVPKVHTDPYGKNSIKYQSTKLWNNLQQILQMDLPLFSSFFIIVKNYRKVKRPETEVAGSIRRFIYSKIAMLHFFEWSEIAPICVMDSIRAV